MEKVKKKSRETWEWSGVVICFYYTMLLHTALRRTGWDDWTKGGCELEGSEDLLDVWFNFFIKPFKCTGHMNCTRTGNYPQAVSWVDFI